MKKITAFFIMLATAGALQAQTNTGDWMVGGTFKINTSKENTQIGFTPSAGTFVVNNLAIGVNLLFDYSKIGDNKETDFGIGPFVRYYFTEADIRPVFHGNLSFLSSRTKTPDESVTNSGLNFFLGAGAAIFISEHVSIDILMGYDHTKLKGFDGSGGFALHAGFQVYLHKSQVDKVRGR